MIQACAKDLNETSFANNNSAQGVADTTLPCKKYRHLLKTYEKVLCDNYYDLSNTLKLRQ